jgi:enoyl-CoA hydratase/carnithine racemase
LELAIACDIRVASERAWFGALEVKHAFLGVMANILPRYIGFGDALYMLLTADRVTSEDALRIGLVQKVVSNDSLMDEALRVAAKISENTQLAVQATKRVAYFWRNFAIRESLELYKAVNQRLMLSEDVLEGPRAFAEKREPKFSNRWPALPMH